ncbi:hypothetical protein [Thiorhodospira sibirica]|uniref:hypothetical protein n=1 Tax=Thiorhodospira sibirica TaxID=154347 RepID=UPI00022C5E29|nr:hypothetical protein [Thiorhodospira sibirica]
MSGWGCPHEYQGRCHHLDGRPCDPGMKGCVLAGRFVFSNPAKNTQRSLQKQKNADQQTDKPLKSRRK